jgi:hypothetical protein
VLRHLVAGQTSMVARSAQRWSEMGVSCMRLSLQPAVNLPPSHAIRGLCALDYDAKTREVQPQGEPPTKLNRKGYIPDACTFIS